MENKWKLLAENSTQFDSLSFASYIDAIDYLIDNLRDDCGKIWAIDLGQLDYSLLVYDGKLIQQAKEGLV